MARENAAFPVDAVDTEGTTELPFNVPAANGVASGSTNDSLLHEARAAPTPSAATQVMRCMAEDLHERGWGLGGLVWPALICPAARRVGHLGFFYMEGTKDG